MIVQEKFDSELVYKLDNSYVSVWVAPTAGANIFKIIHKNSGEDILKTPEKFSDLVDTPEYFGIPVLVPPNRTHLAQFNFENEKFILPKNHGLHNIHGFCHNQEWRFATLFDSDEKSSIILEFNLIDFPEIYSNYPRKLKFEYEISLYDSTLETKFIVHNLDEKRTPFGLGYHTWFNLFGGRKDWQLQVPFESIWELNEESFPTGATKSGEVVDLLRAGISLNEITFDTLFFKGFNQSEITLINKNGFSIVYNVDSKFQHWIIHTPESDQFSIALEPYSCITNAHNLTDIKNNGLLVIPSMGSLTFQTRLEFG